MANQSLGYVTVTTAGTPVRLTKNESVPATRYGVHSYLVEVLSSNTGKLYIGSSGMNKSTGVGVFAILAPPTANNFPSFSSTVVGAAAAYNCADIYLDADTSGEGAVVSAVIA